jgi:hypothetical protein
MRNFQTQPRAVLKRMRRESVEGIVPTQIRMAVVGLRWDIGAPSPPEPLQGMMGLQTGFAQRVSVDATKWSPTMIFRRSVLARGHGAVVPLRLLLEFGLTQFRWIDAIGSDREVNRQAHVCRPAAIVSASWVGQNSDAPGFGPSIWKNIG